MFGCATADNTTLSCNRAAKAEPDIERSCWTVGFCVCLVFGADGLCLVGRCFRSSRKTRPVARRVAGRVAGRVATCERAASAEAPASARSRTAATRGSTAETRWADSRVSRRRGIKGCVSDKACVSGTTE